MTKDDIEEYFLAFVGKINYSNKYLRYIELTQCSKVVGAYKL